MGPHHHATFIAIVAGFIGGGTAVFAALWGTFQQRRQSRRLSHLARARGPVSERVAKLRQAGS